MGPIGREVEARVKKKISDFEKRIERELSRDTLTEYPKFEGVQGMAGYSGICGVQGTTGVDGRQGISNW